MRPSHAAVIVMCLLCRAASAEPLSQLSGRVLDSRIGTPVESALVLISGPGGVEKQLTTLQDGRYITSVRPGNYILIFIYGSARSSGHVTVVEGQASFLDAKLDTTEGEIIEIHDRVRPPEPAKPTNFKPHKAPPYSDKAVLSDAWTRAWLLLDISETGQLLRMKWLKKPGYDLEQIAVAEVKKLTFNPAHDSAGHAIRSFLIWGIEWPSAWWLDKFVGTRSGMPPVVGFPPHRMDDYIPCAGSGPWHMGSLHKTYKDCSKPDLKVASTQPWFAP